MRFQVGLDSEGLGVLVVIIGPCWNASRELVQICFWDAKCYLSSQGILMNPGAANELEMS